MTLLSPRHRWFQYSLRTLFVMVTLAAVFVAYHVNWIQQRHEFLRSNPIPEPLWGRGEGLAPGLLGMFGESEYHTVWVAVALSSERPVGVLSESDEREIRRAQRLFPEAEVLHYFRPKD